MMYSEREIEKRPAVTVYPDIPEQTVFDISADSRYDPTEEPVDLYGRGRPGPDVVFRIENDNGVTLEAFHQDSSYGLDVRSSGYDDVEVLIDDLEENFGLEDYYTANSVQGPSLTVNETAQNLLFTPREAQDVLDNLATSYRVFDPVPLSPRTSIRLTQMPVKCWEAEYNFRAETESAIDMARYMVYIDRLPGGEVNGKEFPEVKNGIAAVDLKPMKNQEWRSKFVVHEIKGKEAKNAVVQSLLESLENVVEDKR